MLQNLRAKLFAIVGTTALAFLILIAASSMISSNVERQLNKIQEHYIPIVELGPRLETQFEHLTRGLQDAVAANDLDALTQTQELKTRLLNELQAAQRSILPQARDALRTAIEEYFLSAFDVSRRLIGLETGEPLVEAIAQMQARQKHVSQLLKKTTLFDRRELTAAFSAAERAQLTASRVQFIISVACMALVLLLSVWLGRGVLQSLAGLTSGFRRFGRGEFEQPIPVATQDELGAVAHEANRMATSLRRLNEERDQSDWLKNGQAGLSQELRGELEPDETAQRAVHFLARYLDAPAAVLYCTNYDNELEPLGFYAVNQPDTEIKLPRFRMGEGLVGQAALSDQVTVINEPPTNYWRVRSGLGETVPQTLVLAPLSHAGKIMGVLELALLTPWYELGRTLLVDVQETLAIAIEVARARAATRELLLETQEQAELLSAQEKEQRATNVMLQAQRQELQKNNAELIEQAEKLEQQRRLLEERNIELDDARLRLEEKARELSTVSAYKSQFLTNMSHELRTPLNSMLLLSNLLAQNEASNLSEKQVEYSNTIHSAGKDLLALINQVLDLAKIESGKQQIKLATVTLASVVLRMQQVFEPLARDKRLNFTVSVSSELPRTIISDSQRIEQILTNLLGNAIKFTEHGSVALNVRKPATTVKFQRPNLHLNTTVAFEVTDTGIGIAEEHRQKIFAPFEQLEATPDRRYGGTGLGLTITRELAVLLEGELQLDSTPGRGSAFVCYLPFEAVGIESKTSDILPLPETLSAQALPKTSVARSPDSVPTPAALMRGRAQPPLFSNDTIKGSSSPLKPVPKSLEGVRVLVVDDDMRTLYALSATLRAQKLVVFAAENGRVALDVLHNNPDMGVVLMDIMMPEMNGYDTMAKIREDGRFADLPIVALTANAMKGDAERCLQAGASAYMAKPIDIDRLLELVASLL